MICGRHHAFLFHAFDQARGFVVADLEMALDEAGRGLAFACDQRHRFVVKIVTAAHVAATEHIAAAIVFAEFAVVFGDRVEVMRLALAF